MSWQERLRQMVLAGGVFVAGCNNDRLGLPNGGGGRGGTGGASGNGDGISDGGGAGGRGGNGGTSAIGGRGGVAGTGGEIGVGGGMGGAGGLGGVGGAGGLGGVGRPDAAAGTGGWTVPPIPCGNANPDPCICGRPDASSDAAAQCATQTACRDAGGVWDYSGSPVGGHCRTDGGVDGALPADAGRDGNLPG